MGTQLGRLGRALGFMKTSAVLFPYPQLVDRPAGSRILVLAPHPDDDVLGCGGTLAKHVDAGDSVEVLYLTDGRKGDPTFGSEHELARERQREARSACRLLGIERLEFLGLPDQGLRATADVVRRVGDEIGLVRPDLIYTPYFLDNHSDHYETSRALAGVREARDINIAAYETWTPIAFPNTAVDISDVVERKELALRCHATQLKVIDYPTAFRGLAAFRGAFVHVRVAEAFMSMKAREYTKVISDFEKRARIPRTPSPLRKQGRDLR